MSFEVFSQNTCANFYNIVTTDNILYLVQNNYKAVANHFESTLNNSIKIVCIKGNVVGRKR